MSEKHEIIFDTPSVSVDGYRMDFPGEYERSGIGVEIHMISMACFAVLHIEGRTVVFLSVDIEEIPASVVETVRNIDILLLPSGKHAVKTYETLEPRIVIPFGENISATLLAIGGADTEPMARYRTKEADFEANTTRFIALTA